MPPLAVNLAVLLLLAGATAALLRRYRLPLATLRPLTRATLALATAGGLLGAPFWWMALPASFAWTLPPLAFRFLAAAGLAFAVVGFCTLARPDPARVRLLLAMIATYLTPLIAAIFLVHRDRLDWGDPLAWGFTAIAAGLAAGALLGMVRAPDLRRAPAPAPAERRLWSLATALFTLWGLALMATPQGPVPALWLWPQDALSGRLIATMLLTLGLMANFARRRADLGRPVALGLATYGLGVAVACLLHAAAGRPLPLAYLAVLGAAGLLAAVRARRP